MKCPKCGQVIGRTLKQNSSGHLWFDRVAEALNDAGYTVNSKEVLRLDVPFTGEVVKDFMFKRIMKAMFPDKTSSRELSKIEWSQIVEVMNANLPVYVEYPHEERDDDWNP